MALIGNLLILLLEIYFWVIIASVIVSWLIAFEVINPRSEQAKNLLGLLDRATEPVFRPLRKFVPPIGGIDLTPIVVILLIALAKWVVAHIFLIG